MTDPGRALRIEAVAGLGEVGPGTDLAAEIGELVAIQPGAIVVVSHKVVSKSEGRVTELGGVTPSPEARELAERTGRDPRLVELVLSESTRVIRATEAALIVETESGLVCANAGIDSSNAGGEGLVVLLPRDPDASAARLRAALGERAGGPVGVVIADSFGRPWRLGQADVAIGCAGIEPLDDRRGTADRDGRTLEATLIATADQVAAAADLAREKASGDPVVLVSGLGHLVVDRDGPGAAALRRPPERDLFR